jgi:hypothetical protein
MNIKMIIVSLVLINAVLVVLCLYAGISLILDTKHLQEGCWLVGLSMIALIAGIRHWLNCKKYWNL